MSFYFQTGEFLSSEAINWLELLVTVITTGISALVAYKIAERTIMHNRQLHDQQITHQRLEEERQENQRKTEKLLYFIWLLDQIKDSANEQNEEYKKLHKAMLENKLSFHRLISLGTYDIKRLLQLNQEDIFQAYIKLAGLNDENRNFVRNLYRQVDFLDGVIKEIYRLFQSMYLEIHSVKLQYQGYLEDIREDAANILDQIKTELGAARVTDPLYKFLNKALLEYNREMPEDADIDWHHYNFLRPLQEHLVHEFIDKREVQPLLIKGRRASILTGRIRFSTENMTSNLSMYSAKIDNTVRKLEQDVEELKKLFNN